MLCEIGILTKNKAHYWDVIAATWQESTPQKLWRKHSDEVNINLFSDWLPSGSAERLLKTDLFDEAASDGLISSLALHTRNIFAMDLSFFAAQSAKRSYPFLQTTGADVRSLPFVDEAFDIIVSNSTLDHFESLEEILRSLRELRRVLRNGGQLILTLDNGLNPMVALRNAFPFKFLNWLGIVPYYVGKTFGPRRLHRTLEQLNFEVARTNCIMHFPRFISVGIARILEKYGTNRIQMKFLQCLMAFEGLSGWPTRFITGHFVAVKAIKRSRSNS